MATLLTPRSAHVLAFAANPVSQTLVVNLLVAASNGLARDDLMLVELHGVRLGPPLFDNLTVGRLVLACGEQGRGIFLDAAARAHCRAPGIFCTEDGKGLALVHIPGVVFGNRPPAAIICEVLTRLGALVLDDLVLPQSSPLPAIQAAAQQAAQALRADRSPVVLAPEEGVLEQVLGHLSANAPCLIQKRSLLHFLQRGDGEALSAPRAWYAPFTALEDADVLLGGAGPAMHLTQRQLARALSREPRVLTGCRTDEGVVLDPWLAGRLTWVALTPPAGAGDTEEGKETP